MTREILSLRRTGWREVDGTAYTVWQRLSYAIRDEEDEWTLEYNLCNGIADATEVYLDEAQAWARYAEIVRATP